VPEPRTITLSLRAWIAVAIVVVVGLLIFVGQLVFIVQQRSLIDSQLHVAQRQEQRAKPVLSTADALLGAPKDALDAARRAGAALTDLQKVLRSALDSDLVGVTTRSLRRAPELLAAVEHAVAVLDRTYPTLRASLDTQRSSLDIQRRTLSLLERSYGLQRDTRDRATETRDLTTQLLEVARATLAHTESIDRKTGGTAPPVVP
jgi:hypothetical protein